MFHGKTLLMYSSLFHLQGPSREEWLRRVKNVYEEFLKEQNIDEAVENYRCLKVPERFTAETVHTTISYLLTLEGKCNTILHNPGEWTAIHKFKVYTFSSHRLTLAILSLESNRELGAQLIDRLRSEGLINVDRLFDGVKLVSKVCLLSSLKFYFIYLIKYWIPTAFIFQY